MTTYTPARAEDLPPALVARFGFILGSQVLRPDPLPECWLWPTTDERGYGKVSTYVDGKIIKVRAHRVAWLIIFGPIPPGVVVRHLCGSHACIRPEHLALGTQVDNANDAKRHGTMPTKGWCAVPSCDRGAKTRGLCGAHAERVRAYGDPIAWLPIRATPGGRQLVVS